MDGEADFIRNPIAGDSKHTIVQLSSAQYQAWAEKAKALVDEWESAPPGATELTCGLKSSDWPA